MLTLNNIIILRNVDLKRFFDVEEFWIQRNAFFDIVKERTADIFFDTPVRFINSPYNLKIIFIYNVTSRFPPICTVSMYSIINHIDIHR